MLINAEGPAGAQTTYNSAMSWKQEQKLNAHTNNKHTVQ